MVARAGPPPARMPLILASQPPKGVSVAASPAAVSPRAPAEPEAPFCRWAGRGGSPWTLPASRARAAGPGEDSRWRFPALPGPACLSGASPRGSWGQTGGPLSEVPPRGVPGRVTRPEWPSPDIRTLLVLPPSAPGCATDAPGSPWPLGPSGVARGTDRNQGTLE